MKYCSFMANIRQELQSAIAQLSALLEQKERIEVDIAKQRRKVAAWQELCATEEDDTPSALPHLESLLDLGGLTEAIKTVLRGSRKEWMNTSEIMTALRELGFPLEKYKAPMASITTTVNRLVDGGEVVVERRSNPGAAEYKWVGPISYEKSLAEHAAEINRQLDEIASRAAEPIRASEEAAVAALNAVKEAHHIAQIAKSQRKAKQD